MFCLIEYIFNQVPVGPIRRGMVPYFVRSNSAGVLSGGILRRTNLLGPGRGRAQDFDPIEPHRGHPLPASPHATAPPLPFRRPRRDPILHRRHGGRRRPNLPVRRQKPDRRELPHRRRRILLDVGHELDAAAAVQLRVEPDGGGCGEVLLHELQPVQHPGVRRGGEQVVEDPSPDAAVPAVAEPGGEPGEGAAGGGGGEEQAEHPEEPEGVGATGMRERMDRDGENAAAAVRAVRGNGSGAGVRRGGAWGVHGHNGAGMLGQGCAVVRHVYQDVAVDSTVSLRCHVVYCRRGGAAARLCL